MNSCIARKYATHKAINIFQLSSLYSILRISLLLNQHSLLSCISILPLLLPSSYLLLDLLLPSQKRDQVCDDGCSVGLVPEILFRKYSRGIVQHSMNSSLNQSLFVSFLFQLFQPLGWCRRLLLLLLPLIAVAVVAVPVDASAQLAWLVVCSSSNNNGDILPDVSAQIALLAVLPMFSAII